jgi:hypothetical protein
MIRIVTVGPFGGRDGDADKMPFHNQWEAENRRGGPAQSRQQIPGDGIVVGVVDNEKRGAKIYSLS